MRTPPATFALLACLMLAGCSFPMGESREDPATDKSEYTGGSALVVTLANEASAPFDVTLVVRDEKGGEFARFETTLEPNATAEKWWSAAGTYELEMQYRARWGSRTASGSDDQRLMVGRDCAELTRVGWRFVDIENGTVGSSYRGLACASAS